jgi:SAM-dependent methyltransferase
VPSVLDGLRRRQTLASFDYQWGEFAEGDAMLSDAWFRERVERILSDEVLCIRPEWFPGRTVLDAGCGAGRWSLGLLRLGCRVHAVDASARALERLWDEMRRWAPDAVAEGRLTTERVDLLDLPDSLRARRFDLVYSFGVLHHTGDTRGALAGLAPLVAADGLLFVYLYGKRSTPPASRALLAAVRAALAPLPFRLKTRILGLVRTRNAHQLFDTCSPLINDLHDHETVEGWLRELGFAEVVRTVAYTELFLRARHGTAPFRSALPEPERPFWFERYRRRALPPG